MNSLNNAISFRSSSPWAGVLLAAFIGVAVVDVLLLAANSTLVLSQREPQRTVSFSRDRRPAVDETGTRVLAVTSSDVGGPAILVAADGYPFELPR